MNQTKRNILRQLLAARQGYPSAPVRQRVGRGAALSTQSNYDGLGTAVESAPTLNIIDKGSRSVFNSERALHRNNFKLKITNSSATHRADVVVTSSLHAAAFGDQVLTDGTNATTNNDGDAVSVDVAADFGIDSTSSSLDNFLTMIREHGAVIANTRLRYQNADQLMHKIKFRQHNWYGDHKIDFIDPEVDFDPTQYHEKVIDTQLRYVLNKNSAMFYSLEPGETVTLSLLVLATQDVDQILMDYARQSGGNVLM